MATITGQDPAVLRSNNIQTNTFKLFMREDTYLMTEQDHVDENLTYFAIEGSGTLGAYNVTGGTGYFTYDPAGNVSPTASGSIIESFSYTLRDEHGNESTANVSITVESMYKGTVLIVR